MAGDGAKSAKAQAVSLIAVGDITCSCRSIADESNQLYAVFDKLKRVAILLLYLFAAVFPASVWADSDRSSLTIDNDLFVSSDNGYTNGIYYSWADTPDNNKAEIGWLVQAMRWSLTERGSAANEYSVKTIGQSMVTPDDIKLEDPPQPPEDLPYAGLLFYNDIWIRAYAQQAEKIGVTVGVVGEYSFAEQSQKLVHEILDGDEPIGWDTQLNDEIVFQFSRAQVWRSWDVLLDCGFEWAVGHSICVSTPIGPIRLDYGFRVPSADDGEPNQVLHLQVGYPF